MLAGQHFDNALELYKKGPSKANQVISELNLELKKNPENWQALMLLAITQRGLTKFDDSLATLDRMEKLDQKNNMLHPQLYMLRVENYYFKKDYKKAKELLIAYWGIFQTSEDLMAKEKELSKAVEKALSGTKESAPPPKEGAEFEEEDNPEKDKAAIAAMFAMRKMKLDFKKYIICPIDRNELGSVLSDSDSKSFLEPIPPEAD